MSVATSDATALWLSVDAWEWIDIVLGIGLVFVGVALEGAAELKRYRRSRILGFQIGRLGLLLVVLGLAVELICAPVVWYLNHLEIAGLQLSTSETLARSSETRLKLEQERLARTRIEVKLARAEEKLVRASAVARRAEQMALPRNLTNQLAPEDKAVLEPFAGTLLVIVSAPDADDETREFARSLRIIDMAGWKVQDVHKHWVMPGLGLWSAQATPMRREPAEVLGRTHKAALALRDFVERETGVKARDWPLEPQVAELALPEVAAAGIDLMSPTLVVVEVGKRSYDNELMDSRWRRHVDEREEQDEEPDGE